MSAYVVGKAHLDALLRVGLEGPTGRDVRPEHAWSPLHWYAGDPPSSNPAASNGRRELRWDNVDTVGALLAAENVRSVQYRYPADGMDTLPGPIANGYATDALLGRYSYPAHGTGPIRLSAMPRPLTAVEALVALDGFEYQSCEHPGWRTSEAWAFCEALRHRLIGCVPGYDEADTWSIA